MHKRRSVIKSLACAAAGVALGGDRVLHRPFLAASDEVVTKRPAPEQRRFVSDAVEAKIVEVKRAIADPELAWLFENCFPNTLDTTVTFSTEHNRPDTYVITGDINAMWLRDSTAQVTPYLPLAREDRKLKDMIAGVINRQTRCILIDPYANSFDFGAKACPWGENDKPPIRAELCERKWEIVLVAMSLLISRKGPGPSKFWATVRQPTCLRCVCRQIRCALQQYPAAPLSLRR